MSSNENLINDSKVVIAVVDDEPRICELITKLLRKLDCVVRPYTDSALCLKELEIDPVDIVITDLHMPDIDGLQMLKAIKAMNDATEVIMVTAMANKDIAIQALKLGAYDFFEKPLHGAELIETVKRTMRYRLAVRERDRLADQVSFLTEQEAKHWGVDAFVGKSAAMNATLNDISKVQRAANTSVLITGESGVGKELVARSIHFGGIRSSSPFIPLNCAAVPADLAESILFGHVKGAFTGAAMDKKGSFELADGGTLFLDEIGDMPSNMQAKLLRVLEDGKITPVGGASERTVDVRVIAATNSDLNAKIKAREFRSDLYHRIAVFTIGVPPLRERADDIPVLAAYFLEVLSLEMGLLTPSLSEDASDALKHHAFPGNVRELKNVIERALIRASGDGVIQRSHLSFVEMADTPAPEPTEASPANTDALVPENLPYSLDELEKLAVQRAMDSARGNVSEAARLLGMSRTNLYRKLKEA